MKVQTKFNRASKDRIINSNDIGAIPLLASQCPSIIKIAEMFFNGKPMTQLNADLPFNTIEDNPLYRKGFDLAEYPALVRSVKEAKQAYTDELQKAHSTIPSDVDTTGSLNPVAPPEKVE